MGCTQSTANETTKKPAQSAPSGLSQQSQQPAEHAVSLRVAGTGGHSPTENTERQCSPTASVPSGPDGGNGSAAVESETPPDVCLPDSDAVGSTYVPPPGGRQGHSMAAGPPTNLAEIPGEPAGSGRVARPPVTLASGAVYEGQWKDPLRDGEGKLSWPDGQTYEGSFKKDECHGEGTWSDSKGNVFEGQWQHNRINGTGKFTHSDGSVYEGQWKDDVKHGKGKETWGDGTVYEGEFVKGDKKGKGSITFPDGSHYVGSFDKDFFDGKGTYTWPNGRTYEGAWKDGYMHGQGVYKWPQGQFLKYEGPYEQSMKSGAGKLFLRDGRIYVANFARGKMDGEVVEISPSGKKRKGIWKDGKHVKWTEQGKAPLFVGEEAADTATAADYETSAYSNPNKYHQLYQGKKKQHMKIEGGVLHGKAGAAPEFHASPQ
ncbi:MORN repeat-containing protein [Toxoplasma gondii ME49]|uniref:MORN repeat-containing protein n=7 Tax=Toxoplasma gondii TaxID=5811 RepID=B6K916_TOXGV|nr:MORN repeat-containing protein [Toxoplasma gondii ME49]ESS35079.1 MORN repeat-containing protein [Toxoplasma gondii VEG]KYF48350.1 MORN repeat-containing protein [Toxoplasma gondii ARI]PIM00577.1 MORN repeat-containing protein [Toxoplasma gondii COUG]EPT25936.1 MORN repeat-containing protein [Toxoplasma gondii ME49]CEL77569.1 TPA: phosphatidylinositol-4-phosphate 5-kinase,putative [Toxoplasma gondii VEG]|eukprot:XP_002364540.1 MORN repeat-containing protein [Toxoplasma gondii ME49]